MNERDKGLFLRGLEVGLRLADEYKTEEVIAQMQQKTVRVRGNGKAKGKKKFVDALGNRKWLEKKSAKGGIYYVLNPAFNPDAVAPEPTGLAHLGQTPE